MVVQGRRGVSDLDEKTCTRPQLMQRRAPRGFTTVGFFPTHSPLGIPCPPSTDLIGARFSQSGMFSRTHLQERWTKNKERGLCSARHQAPRSPTAHQKHSPGYPRSISFHQIMPTSYVRACEQNPDGGTSRPAVGEGDAPARGRPRREHYRDSYRPGGDPGLDLPPVHGSSQASRRSVEPERLLVELVGLVHQQLERGRAGQRGEQTNVHAGPGGVGTRKTCYKRNRQCVRTSAPTRGRQVCLGARRVRGSLARQGNLFSVDGGRSQATVTMAGWLTTKPQRPSQSTQAFFTRHVLPDEKTAWLAKKKSNKNSAHDIRPVNPFATDK